MTNNELQSIGKGKCADCTLKMPLYPFGTREICKGCISRHSAISAYNAIKSKSNMNFLAARKAMGGEDF
jgi:hypothetical protein